MKKNGQTYLDSGWWKQHKAKTVKDQGLEAALIKYESAAKGVDKDTISKETYTAIVAALKLVEKAAAKTLEDRGTLAKVGGAATKSHLEGYDWVLGAKRKEIEEWKQGYEKRIKAGIEGCQKLLVEAKSVQAQAEDQEQEVGDISKELATAVSNGALDAAMEKDLRSRLASAKGSIGPIQNQANDIQARAIKHDATLPASFVKDSDSDASRDTYDLLNKAHAVLKILGQEIPKVEAQLKAGVELAAASAEATAILKPLLAKGKLARDIEADFLAKLDTYNKAKKKGADDMYAIAAKEDFLKVQKKRQALLRDAIGSIQAAQKTHGKKDAFKPAMQELQHLEKAAEKDVIVK